MADSKEPYQSVHSGAEIDAGIDLLDKNSATQGQVLTANGTGGASWQNTSGGGGGNQIYLHEITISINGFMGSFYLINDISTQITSIGNCNNGFAPSYSGYFGSIVLYKMTGMPFDTHTLNFKNCLVAQALGFAEDSDGNQIQNCSDTVMPL